MSSEFRTFRSLASLKKVAKASGLKVKLVSRNTHSTYYQVRTAEGTTVGFFNEGPPGWLSIKTHGEIHRAALTERAK